MSENFTSTKRENSLLNYQNFYLVGIKGVAMSSIAQCLLDAGKNVRGSDVEEDFVTAKILQKRKIAIDSFTEDFLEETKNRKPDCLIYTAAHQGVDHPQVKKAIKNKIPIFSQAEALADLFNQNEGVAVCGVGGKSTISAMIIWVLKQLNISISFSLGVGEIIGLAETGQWDSRSTYFIAEADEYVVDTNALKKGEKFKARFSFLKPSLVVCSNLSYDHPDVYASFDETKNTFKKFFLQIKRDGFLIINQDNKELLKLSQELKKLRKDINIISFSWVKTADYFLSNYQIKNGHSLATVNQKLIGNIKQAQLRLKVPGQFNLMNALAAIAALSELQIPLQQSCQALSKFQSTKRRFELINIQNSQRFFDDYAHHPSELSELIRSLNQYFPNQNKLIAFQPHTYSRTKALFKDFVEVLGSNLNENDQLVILNIFASARESKDNTVSSIKLVKAIQDKFPKTKVLHLKNIKDLADYIKKNNFALTITVGAGDIYKVYELLPFSQ
jgi:UDP-N-acetylmuramate--alanine ligase